MKRLKPYFVRHWAQYLLGGLCLLGTASLVMTIPWVIKKTVDSMGRGVDARLIAYYSLGMILLAVLLAVIRTLSRALIFNAGRDIEYELRSDLYIHLQRLPLDYYQNQRTGDLMSRVINDISSVRMLLGPGILNLINTPLYYVYGLTMMFMISAPLTLLAVAPLPVLVFSIKRLRRLLLVRSLKVQEGMASLSNHVQENLSGMHVVKAYAQEENQTRLFADLNEDFKGKNMALARVRAIMQPFMNAVTGVGVLIVVGYGGTKVAQGDLSIGDLVAFIAYLNALAWPTAGLGWTFSLYERGRAALGRLEHVFAVEPSIQNPASPRLPKSVNGKVEFCEVDFAYAVVGDGKPVLKKISFEVPAGTTTAIVGRTGSGKSTLAHLVPRLIDASSGSVCIDGVDVREGRLDLLRSKIALVTQDPFLFSATLRKNILFGSGDISEDSLQRILGASGLAKDIAEFPDGLETVVGERGITLSGGQKQRTTLARALACDPRILILDDALSSVDTHTEAEILRELRAIMKERTSIIISHRISAIKDADQILVLNEGEVVEQGKHEHLMELGGVYFDLFREQEISEELEVSVDSGRAT